MGEKVRVRLEGLDCANCALKLESALQKEVGAGNASINFATSTLEIPPGELERAQGIISGIEPEVKIKNEESRGQSYLKHQKQEVIKISLSLLLLILGVIFEKQLHGAGSWRFLEYVLFLSAYLLVGFDVLKASVANLIRGEFFDENALMSIATIGAIAIHQLPEAVAVMLFFAVGESLQSYAVERSRTSITSLLSLRSHEAVVRRGSAFETVDPDEVLVGEEIVVRPGERIPLDGEVIEGESFVDTAVLTGEAVPRRIAVGDEALAGMVNKSGLLTLKVTKPAKESAIARILALVEEAASKKADAEETITTFARYYTPAVVLLAAAIAILPPLFTGAAFSLWLYRALVLLVISCPCALVISVPLGYFGGLGAASRNGVLVKGANYLDQLAKLEAVAFDKTGTLTEGTFEVVGIYPQEGVTKEEVLATAAKLEVASPHPIAASILAAFGQEVDPGVISDYQEVPGHGIKGTIEGQKVIVGTDRFLHKEEIPHPKAVCRTAGTIAHVAVEGRYLGYLEISDLIKQGARESLLELRQEGIGKLIMLTGDDQSVADDVGQELALDAAYGQLLPEDKVSRLEELLGEGTLAFVGDGINDAPVLMRADLGVAMGALGSDAAIEAADVVIMDDELARLPQAIRIAKKTRQLVYGNIAFALFVKLLFLFLGAFGISGIWFAVFADVGVTLIAILNSTRILRFKP